MRILQLHSDYIIYKPVKKEIKNAEEAEEVSNKIEDVLVLFTCVEKGDNGDIAKKAIEDARDFMENIKVDKILLYPYAHLSNNLASPRSALDILKHMEVVSNDMDIETYRAPFGWAKEFTISVKGHPLAEQSRRYPENGNVVEKDNTEDDRTLEQKKSRMFRTSRTAVEDLPENDHRRLGQKLDLFSFHDAAPGMPFFHNNGMIIRNQLLRFWKDEHNKENYQEIKTPILLNKNLWEISGHWDHYRKNMYFTNIDDESYAIKPMNCPGGILIFKNNIVSYRDLPMRVAELGLVHRHELSGVLSGLFRVRSFTQDDAHIYMTQDQIKDEIIGVINLTKRFYETFGFEFHVELSTKPDNSIGTDEQWELAEAGLKSALDEIDMDYKLNPGDGAFYGPKIDFHIEDAMERTWQCGTIQLDMTMPEKFDLNYTGEDGKPHRVVMVHRTIMGSIERFMGILIEHFNGNFPVWLAPIQLIVIPITDKNLEYAKKIEQKFSGACIRSEIDSSSNTMDYKIRDAQLKKIPYMIVIGDKEEDKENISVRDRDGKVRHNVDVSEFKKEILDKIENKKID